MVAIYPTATTEPHLLNYDSVLGPSLLSAVEASEWDLPPDHVCRSGPRAAAAAVRARPGRVPPAAEPGELSSFSRLGESSSFVFLCHV
jgi:hypothetical protein